MAGTGDVAALQTASSLEELAVAVYQTAIDSGLVKTAAIGDAAKLFQSQHKEHSQLFQGATSKAGGTPFAKPNPAVLEQLQPTIKALKDETGIVMLAHSLETAAAETYQKVVGTLKDLTLNQAFMSVGGTEARHAVILASGAENEPPDPEGLPAGGHGGARGHRRSEGAGGAAPVGGQHHSTGAACLLGASALGRG